MQVTFARNFVSELEHQWFLSNCSPELQEMLRVWACSCLWASEGSESDRKLALILHLPSERHRSESDDVVRQIYRELKSGETSISQLYVISPEHWDLAWEREIDASQKRKKEG